MTAVRQIPQPAMEAGGDEYLLKTICGRAFGVERAYTLRVHLDKARSHAEREAIIEHYAEITGRSRWQLEQEARWTEGFRLQDLHDAFAAEGIGDREWLERLDERHLALIGEAREGHRVLTSKEKARLAVECYHANWAVSELRQDLVARGYVKAPPGMPTAPTKKLMMSRYLIQMGEQLQRKGVDFEVDSIPGIWDRLRPAHEVLWLIMDRLRRLYPREMDPVGKPMPEGRHQRK